MTNNKYPELPIVGYLRATKAGEPIWSEDCVCEDPVYPSDPDGSDSDCISMPVVRLVDADRAMRAGGASALQGKVTRHSDQSVLVTFPSSRLASEFERSLGAEGAPASVEVQSDAEIVLRELVDAVEGVILEGGSVSIDNTSSGWFDRARAALAAQPQEAAPPRGTVEWRSAVLDLIDECPGLDMEQDHWLSRRVKELDFPSAPREAAPSQDAALNLFNAGWKAAAKFCNRDDVIADGLVGGSGCPQFEEAFKAARAQAKEEAP